MSSAIPLNLDQSKILLFGERVNDPAVSKNVRKQTISNTTSCVCHTLLPTTMDNNIYQFCTSYDNKYLPSNTDI